MTMIGPLMLDVAGTELTDEDRELICSTSCGGLILFSRNFINAEQVLALTNAIREVNPQIIIAVDQEGGRVQRFKDGFSKLPPLSILGKLFEKDSSYASEMAFVLGELMALEVQAVGCDISFAPVLDLGYSTSKVIGDRAFAEEPQVISLLAKEYIKGMNAAGMAATGKHFPGHGSVAEDSHFDLPYDSREWKRIAQLDLLPFVDLKNQLAALMPAHIVYDKIDSKPAGFSRVWLEDILRKQIGFEGVIFSDDLTMEGATIMGSYAERALNAVSAGCDMVLVCNNRQAAIEVLNALKSQPISSLSSGRLSRLKMPNKPIGLEALKNTPRWQVLSAKLATIN